MALCALASAPEARAQVTATFRYGQSPTAAYTEGDAIRLFDGAYEAWDPNTNYSGTSRPQGRTDGAGAPVQTLFKCDLTSIPFTALITAATLTLEIGDTSAATNSVYALSRAWVPSQVTWNQFATGSPWQTPGAQGGSDRGVLLATFTPTTFGSFTFPFNSNGVAMVQSWVTGMGVTNQGVIFSSLGSSDGTRWINSFSSTPSVRPLLTITYNAGTVARFQNGVSPSTGYSGCVDAIIGNYPDPKTTFSGSALYLSGPATSGTNIALARFLTAVDGGVPPWSTVQGATLEAYAESTHPDPFTFYELKRPWSLASATWNEASPGVPWQTPGAAGPQDRDPTPLGTLSVSSVGPKLAAFNAAGVAVVQHWVEDAATNHGFSIENRTSTSGSNAAVGNRNSGLPASHVIGFAISYVEGQLRAVPQPRVGPTVRQLAVMRARMDGGALGPGPGPLQVQVFATGAEVSSSGASAGPWSGVTLVTIPAGAEVSPPFQLRVLADAGSIAFDAGPAWVAPSPLDFGFPDGTGGGGGGNAGGAGGAGGGPAAGHQYNVGCGCQSLRDTALLGLLGWTQRTRRRRR